VRDGKDVRSRIGILSTINLIPLLVGTRTMSDLLGITLRSQLLMHRWIGIVATSQAVWHAVWCIINHAGLTWNATTICGVVVSRLDFPRA
jgi:hypothetical protein